MRPFSSVGRRSGREALRLFGFAPLGGILAVYSGMAIVRATLGTSQHYPTSIFVGVICYITGVVLVSYRLPAVVRERRFGRCPVTVGEETIRIGEEVFERGPAAAVVLEVFTLENLMGQPAVEIHRIRWVEEATDAGIGELPSGWGEAFGHPGNVLVTYDRHAGEARRTALGESETS